MPERKRYRQVCLRLTDDEYALFEKKCSDSGMSKTDFLVSVLKNSTVNVYRIDEALRPLMKELRYIGITARTHGRLKRPSTVGRGLSDVF